MKSRILSHLYRYSPDLLFPARRVWAGNSPNPAPATGPTPAPVGGPQENADTSAFRKALTKLKSDLDTKGTGGSLLKFAEDHGDSMSDWQTNPQSAIKFFEDYERSLAVGPTGAASDLQLAAEHRANIRNLIDVLKNPPNADGTGCDPEKFAVAKEVILAIAVNINRRKSEIAKAKDALGNLSENAVTKKVSTIFENATNTYGRMSMPEKAATLVAIGLFFKMALSDKDGNMVFGPMVKLALGAGGANLLIQAATGKSGIEHLGEKLELGRFLPMTADQLPDFMKALALKTSRDRGVKIDMPSELVAIGKLGTQKMSALLAVYSPTGNSIDPAIFGLRPAKDGDPASGEITAKHLYLLVDTMVRKHGTQGSGRDALGDMEAFRRAYCAEGRHDFTFMETVSDLFQEESMELIADSMNPEEWEKYKNVVEHDTTDIWKKDAPSVIDCKPEVRRFGVKFYGLTFLTKQVKSSDGNQYVYHIGERSVTVGVNDTVDSRRESARLLKDYATKYLQEQVALYGRGTGLSQNSGGDTYTSDLQWIGGNTWELRNVETSGGAPISVKLAEYGEGGDFMVTNPANGQSTKLDSTFATTGKAILD